MRYYHTVNCRCAIGQIYNFNLYLLNFNLTISDIHYVVFDDFDQSRLFR